MSKERRLVLTAAAVVGMATVGCYSGPRVDVERSYLGCVVGTNSQPAGFPPFLFPPTHSAVVDFGEGLGIRSVTAKDGQATRQFGEIKPGQQVVVDVKASTDGRNLAIDMAPEEVAEELVGKLKEFLQARIEYPPGSSTLTDGDKVKRFGTVGIEVEATGENCTP